MTFTFFLIQFSGELLADIGSVSCIGLLCFLDHVNNIYMYKLLFPSKKGQKNILWASSPFGMISLIRASLVTIRLACQLISKFIKLMHGFKIHTMNVDNIRNNLGFNRLRIPHFVEQLLVQYNEHYN